MKKLPPLTGLEWKMTLPNQWTLWNDAGRAIVSVAFTGNRYECGVYGRGWSVLDGVATWEEAKALALVKLRMQT